MWHLELVDQILGAGLLGVDHAAKLAGKLRIHLIKQLGQQAGVADVAGKHNALAGQLPVGIAQAVVHQVAQDDAVGALVEHRSINLLSVEIQRVRVDTLVFQLRHLFIRQMFGFDAIAQKLGGVRHHAERHQMAIRNRLLQRIVGRG